MKILFALDAAPWPSSVNGAVITMHEYALELIKLGHQVAVFGTLSDSGWRSLLLRVIAKANGTGIARDERSGYPIYRSWAVCEAASGVCADFKPDVAVVFAGEMTPLALALERTGSRIWLYHHTISRFLDAGFQPKPDWGQMACSAFIANAYAAAHGSTPAVVRPFTQREKYHVPRRGNSVLFVNPIPDKGVELALDIAEYRQDVKFIFLESWTISNESLLRVRGRARRLSNITWQRPTDDMRAVFSSTRLVLIPSRWEEPWGRLPREAYCSGIPVLASAIGGLVESVGSGGRLISPSATVADWLAAFSAIWDDQAEYERYSRAALAVSNQQESTPEICARAMVSLLGRAHAVSPPVD